MDGVENCLSSYGRSANFLRPRCARSSNQRVSAITNQIPGVLEGFKRDVTEALNASGYINVNTAPAQRIQVYLSLEQGSQAEGVSQLDCCEAPAVARTSAHQITEYTDQAINTQAHIEPWAAKKLLAWRL